MTIDTVIDDLATNISAAGYPAYIIPAEHVHSATNASFVTITESDIEAESVEAYNMYIMTVGIDVEIHAHASDHESALRVARSIRDDVISVLNTYTEQQILIRRITNAQTEMGQVQYNIECSLQLPPLT